MALLDRCDVARLAATLLLLSTEFLLLVGEAKLIRLVEAWIVFVVGPRSPETQVVGIEGVVASDGHVVRGCDAHFASFPGSLPWGANSLACLIADLAVESDLVCHIRSLDLPRVSLLEPVVRHLYLLSFVSQLLPEHTIVIAKPIAPAWHFLSD